MKGKHFDALLKKAGEAKNLYICPRCGNLFVKGGIITTNTGKKIQVWVCQRCQFRATNPEEYALKRKGGKK